MNVAIVRDALEERLKYYERVLEGARLPESIEKWSALAAGVRAELDKL